jgi:hypothetical protein
VSTPRSAGLAKPAITVLWAQRFRLRVPLDSIAARARLLAAAVAQVMRVHHLVRRVRLPSAVDLRRHPATIVSPAQCRPMVKHVQLASSVQAVVWRAATAVPASRVLLDHRRQTLPLQSALSVPGVRLGRHRASHVA